MVTITERSVCVCFLKNVLVQYKEPKYYGTHSLPLCQCYPYDFYQLQTSSDSMEEITLFLNLPGRKPKYWQFIGHPAILTLRKLVMLL